MGRIIRKRPSDMHIIVRTGPHSTFAEHEARFGTMRNVAELVLLAIRKLDPHVLGIERIVVRDGMLDIVRLTEFPLRNGRLIFLDGRLALQGIRLRLKGMHLIAKRRNRGIRCINPLPQELDVFLAFPVPLFRAPVLENPANNRHTERENESDKFDAVL